MGQVYAPFLICNQFSHSRVSYSYKCYIGKHARTSVHAWLIACDKTYNMDGFAVSVRDTR